MAISFVGQATGVTSATLPTHQAGDLILAFAYRDGNNTAPTVPSPFITIASAGGSSNSSALAYYTAINGSTTSGTWTNATSVVFLIYRGCTPVSPIGNNAVGVGNNTTIIYPALTPSRTDGTSWVVGFAGHRSTNTSIGTAPTGMTNRASVSDATDQAAGHDTNAPVTSWSATSVAVGGTNSNWIARTVEIEDVALHDLVETETGTGTIVANATVIPPTLLSGSYTASATITANAEIKLPILLTENYTGTATLSSIETFIVNNGRRFTEDSNRRITETGDVRVLEGYVALGFTFDETLALSSTGSTAVVPGLILNNTLSLVGSLATLSASTISRGAVSALSAQGSLSGSADQSKNFTASLSSSGTLSGNLGFQLGVTASHSASGSVSASSSIIKDISSTRNATTSFDFIADVIRGVQASLSSSGSISGVILGNNDVNSDMASSGSLASSASLTHGASATITASAVSTIYPQFINGFASLTGGTATLYADAITLNTLNTELISTGTLNGNLEMIHSAIFSPEIDRRITEGGDVRITETGDFRVVSGQNSLAESVFQASATVIPFTENIYTKSGGVWKSVTPSVYHNGQWKRPLVYVNDNGAWKRVY